MLWYRNIMNAHWKDVDRLGAELVEAAQTPSEVVQVAQSTPASQLPHTSEVQQEPIIELQPSQTSEVQQEPIMEHQPPQVDIAQQGLLEVPVYQKTNKKKRQIKGKVSYANLFGICS
jgi:hypothetical protein